MSSINDIVRRLRENRILSEKTDYSKTPRDELIKRAQDGDQLAIETLINNHRDFIKMMSSKYFFDSLDREEVEHLATIAFWDAIMNWDMSGDFNAYAGMIIKRKMTNELRKEDTGKRQINNTAQSLNATTTDDEGGESSMIDKLASTEISPEEEILGKEGARALMDYMRDKFSEREREVVSLKVKGFSISDIMEETGLSYKQVENTLKRIKDKIAEYMRSSYKESKKLKESKEVEFTDEEKRVLESVLTKVEEEVSIRESKVKALRESYEDYTETQFEEELYAIESKIKDIRDDMRETYYDKREDLIDELKELEYKLYAMEDFAPEELQKNIRELHSMINSVEETEYDGPDVNDVDPYIERGLRISDFY